MNHKSVHVGQMSCLLLEALTGPQPRRCHEALVLDVLPSPQSICKRKSHLKFEEEGLPSVVPPAKRVALPLSSPSPVRTLHANP
jgi:hypothetical protein